MSLTKPQISCYEGILDCYKNILEGNGFPLLEAKTAIEIVHEIRTQTPIGKQGDYHPFIKLPSSNHPFNQN
jgi:UDP-N-acetyl-2-amino-2-deoxyglucuronate dehydrogenase